MSVKFVCLAGNFSPAGWQFCDGSLLSISENETLFQLIGTTYGGDGESTFAVPDLRGRIPIHQGQRTSFLRKPEELEEVTLTVSQIPAHSHPFIGTTTSGTVTNPSNAFLASSTVVSLYAAETANAAMATNAIGSVGGSQPHTNFQPYLCVSFIISLFGIFPSPT